MKKVLIISPHFPPVNAPDMHRVRQALAYFREFGWDAEVIAVDPKYVESNSLDTLLTKTFPDSIKINWVRAFETNKTRKIGLGSLSLRSFFFIRKKGNQILRDNNFDLIFFSTTAFHVMALGPYWKRKFRIPFIIDIQDPWRSDFYLDKPKNERPPKFWISYYIDKFLEKITVPYADGIMSVSDGYIDVFHDRYKNSKNIPAITLPFGGNPVDFEIAKSISSENSISLDRTKRNIIYIGRGGHDLKKSITIFFTALNKIAAEDPGLYSSIHVFFIGTSYAPHGKGVKTIEPIAKLFGLFDKVTEITDRLPYFETLNVLTRADMLFVPGSVDTLYTASKIYPYILAQKPLLAIFHFKSSVVEIINTTNSGKCITFDEKEITIEQIEACKTSILQFIRHGAQLSTNWTSFEPFTAKSMTQKIVGFFEKVLENNKLHNKH